jgi:hypothetical protein
MIASMPSLPTRRSVVRAGGLGAMVLGLSACGIRLESDAPRIPLVPTRTPRPGEEGLRALLDNGARVVAACQAWTGPDAAPAATLAGLVRTQDTTLAALLDAAGAPTPTPSPTGTGTATSTTPAGGGSATDAARAAAGAVAALEDLEPIGPELRPTVASILASRVAWAATLGQPDALASAAATPTRRPTGTPTSSAPAAATPWLQATWAARYAFQVVTARSAGAQRLHGRRTLELLDRTETAQLAALGTTAPPEPIGFDLPFAVTDAASARRLAVHAGEGLRTAYGAQLGAPVGADPLLTAARWLSVAERIVLEWGGKAEPFPGLVA